MGANSRIERARERARAAKAAIGALTLLVFGAAFVGPKIHAPGHAKGKAGASGSAVLLRASRSSQRRARWPDRTRRPASTGRQRDVVNAGAVSRFRAMGCEVVLAGGDVTTVAAVLERWENTFSLFRPDSELSRVNRSGARVLAVSWLFARTLETARDVAAETEGLVDPTLSRRWAEISLSGRLLSRPPGLELDLNGVVKSLAVDEAAATLHDPGFVSVGGDLAVRGPVDVALPAEGAVRVQAGGLATSGTTSRGAHLLDAATGRPSDSRWSQVTASGVTCLAADVAAKAGFLLGERGPNWLDERGIPGRFVDADGEVVENETWASATREVPACT
jgi:FAD:protein FMN transferase